MTILVPVWALLLLLRLLWRPTNPLTRISARLYLAWLATFFVVGDIVLVHWVQVLAR
jgi:hypothetical protein